MVASQPWRLLYHFALGWCQFRACFCSSSCLLLPADVYGSFFIRFSSGHMSCSVQRLCSICDSSTGTWSPPENDDAAWHDVDGDGEVKGIGQYNAESEVEKVHAARHKVGVIGEAVLLPCLGHVICHTDCVLAIGIARNLIVPSDKILIQSTRNSVKSTHGQQRLRRFTCIVCTTTMTKNVTRWKRFRISEQISWNKLLMSNFLNKLPLISTKFNIFLVSRLLLFELTATLRVVARNIINALGRPT